MFPHVGLYLPDSLHRDQSDTTERKESQPVKRKYFERKSIARDRDSDDRKSMALSRKSSDDVTRIFSSLSTVFDFADYASTQGKVSTENKDFLNLIQRVQQDVTEASRLYASYAVTDYLESWPDKKTWIDRILLDIERTLNDIGVYMETVRVSGDDGGAAALRRKFEWILSHQKKLISKQQNLTACHSSLMSAVTMMQAAEMNAAFGGQDPVFEAPARPWIRDEDSGILRSPHSRQKWRLSQRNLSLPSITVSEAEGDKGEGDSINSTPVELPGSTPDDMPDPNNWDLYAPPKKLRRPSEEAIQHIPLDQAQAHPSEETEAIEASHSPKEVPPNPCQTLPRPPSDLVPTKRSFDHGRPSLSSIQGPPRASFDQPRPRAYSDQVLPSRSFEMRPRASADQVTPLPTVTEKPLERYDSTASVAIADAATVPLAGMRYRPKAVQVKKPPVKHRSLPSKLPAVSSTSSLMDELSHWVLPASARESYRSTDTNISLDPSSPATSVASMPPVPSPASFPAVLNESIPFMTSPRPESPSAAAGTASEERKTLPTTDKPVMPSEQASQVPDAVVGDANPTPLEPRRDVSNEAVPLSSPLENPSKLVRRLLANATNAKSQMSSSKPTTDTQPIFSTPNDPPPLHQSAVEPLEQVVASEEQPPSPPPRPPKLPESTAEPKALKRVESASSTNEPTPASTPPLTPQPPKLPENAPEPKRVERVESTLSTNEPAPASASGSSSPTSTRSFQSHHTVKRKPVPAPVAPAPPMTALAKRRAAHARRMQLAFGAE